ncbi:acetylglutamate kinase [Salisediminibacterium selenitireducens]|uniref:Acetylglutamate kinase n=1 Tax=Bacillus selenitireducens (strain ATCC 700615 / DSM 15326 / MLS10) TaxID=439292 RepID=D6XUI6_BACIE|nr:acetylglutamate kinase [Salisediminibacterium selenitireducens]ADH99472.1 acetylglutamate kinase [[Bacillus] selenitireducens MLS10]
MKPAIIKIGGSTISQLPSTFYRDIGELYETRQVVVVHGGGPAINESLAKQQIKPDFHQGLRVTSSAVMKVVEEVLAGSLNKALVRHFSDQNVKAAGISGQDGQLLKARILNEKLGLVGDVKEVNPSVIHALLNAGFIPVIAPVGLGEHGEALNINADHAAVHIAKSLGGDLIFATDVPGVMKHNHVLTHLSHDEAKDLIKDGTISGGMIPKVEAALHAVQSGIEQTFILNGFETGVITAYQHNRSTGTTFSKKVVQS